MMALRLIQRKRPGDEYDSVEASVKKHRVSREELYSEIKEGLYIGTDFLTMGNLSTVVTQILFLLLVISLCGCTAGLAMQGLSSGAPVAFNASGSGKGDSAWFARYDDVVQATLRAGEKLSFQLREKNNGRDKSAFTFVDDKGAKLRIVIERRTETLTRIRFNVGLFGSESIGRLMARQIIVEVAEAEDFLRDWHPTEDN